MTLTPKQIKLDASTWEDLAGIGRYLGIVHGKHGNHSEVIRKITSTGIMLWKESPYLCQSAKYVVFATAAGDVFFRQVQTLRLNKRRDRLPCLMEMKPEKRRDFFAAKQERMDQAAWVKSHWLINYFGAWHGNKIAPEEFLDDWVDRDGIDIKQADLSVNLSPNATLTREILVGARDYVQRRPRQNRNEYDRVGFPVDIPTRNLEATVIIDVELYKKGSLPLEEIPPLSLEFRNRESARFEGDPISHDHWNRMGLTISGFHPTPSLAPKEVIKDLSELQKRIKVLAQSTVKDGPVVPAKEQPALKSALKTPKSFLYYRLSWPTPYLGIEVCVNWQKPEKRGGTN